MQDIKLESRLEISGIQINQKLDIKQQAITGYSTEGIDYRKLAAKYGVNRSTISKFVYGKSCKNTGNLLF